MMMGRKRIRPLPHPESLVHLEYAIKEEALRLRIESVHQAVRDMFRGVTPRVGMDHLTQIHQRSSSINAHEDVRRFNELYATWNAHKLEWAMVALREYLHN